MQAATTLLAIFFTLLTGFVIGLFLSKKIAYFLTQLLAPLVWLLLFSIGLIFGNVLNSSAIVQRALFSAFIFAALTTFIPSILIYSAVYFKSLRKTQCSTIHPKKTGFLKPLKECSIALGMFISGVIVVQIGPASLKNIDPHLSMKFLFVMLFIVGIEMARIKFDRRWFSLASWVVPLLVIIGSLTAGFIASFITGESISVSLALASGYGWFSLSSVMLANKLGDYYGILGLLIDLFRELAAITFLYLFGSRAPYPCIGAAGATAFDSTLPMIKQVCEPRYLPIAFMSGLWLTVATPLLINFFLS